jgi:hypothetical protein
MDAEDPESIRSIRTQDGEEYLCCLQKNGTLLLERDAYESIQGGYWLAPGEKDPETYGDKVRQVAFPAGGYREALKKLLERSFHVDAVFWCQICEDYTFEENHGVSECGHIRYVDSFSDWGGCGYVESDHQEDYAQSFQAVRSMLGPEDVSQLVQWLNQRNCGEIWRFTDRYSFSNEKCEAAFVLLDSLNDQVPQKVFDLIAVWVDATELKHDHR